MSIPRDYLPLTFTDSWGLLNAYELNVRRYAFHRTVSGQYYPEEWDQYAPESMTHILKQWRERVRESLNDDDEIKFHHPDNKPDDYSKLKEGHQIRWSTENQYVDIPKAVIPSLIAPGLDIFGDISGDMIAALGLTDEECKFLKSKYDEMESEFQTLQINHFHVINDPAFNYQLDEFPDEAHTLRDKWTAALDAHFNQPRATLIDLFIRKEISSINFELKSFKYREAMRNLEKFSPEPIWLNAGTETVKIFFKSSIDQKGNVKYEFRSQSIGKGNTSSSGSSPRVIPESFQHLFEPIISAPSLEQL